MPSGKVLVVLRHSPSASGNAEEGLRVAIGLTIIHPRVDVLLLDDAAILALPDALEGGEKGWRRHWRTLGDLGQRRLVERESLEALGAGTDEMAPGAEVVSRDEANRLLGLAEVVAVF